MHFVLVALLHVRLTASMCAWPVSPFQTYMQWQMNAWGSFIVMPVVSTSTLFLQALKPSYSSLSYVWSGLGPFVKMSCTILTSPYGLGYAASMLATEVRALGQLSHSLMFTKSMLEGKDDPSLWNTDMG